MPPSSLAFLGRRCAERCLFLTVSKELFRAFLGVAPALERSVTAHAKTRLLERYRALQVLLPLPLGAYPPSHRLLERSRALQVPFLR